MTDKPLSKVSEGITAAAEFVMCPSNIHQENYCRALREQPTMASCWITAWTVKLPINWTTFTR